VRPTYLGPTAINDTEKDPVTNSMRPEKLKEEGKHEEKRYRKQEMIQEENAEDEQPKNKGEVSKDTKSIKTECYAEETEERREKGIEKGDKREQGRQKT
jgi:hypothetical protein